MPQRPRFERPPVVEVVCGVLFGALPNLRTAHIGVFWDQVRTEFPAADEAPPLQPIIERGSAFPVHLELTAVPPLPRTWLRSADGHKLVQIQRDRFLYNWKRDSPEDGPYPSYDKVIIGFERYWYEFGTFVARENLGELIPRQFDLSYVNVIPITSIPAGVEAFVDHRYDRTRARFLVQPDDHAWHEVYALPKASGRLHVIAATGRHEFTGDQLIRIEIVARGINDSSADMRAWFDLAHEWIVHGFADVTTERMQHEVWRRQA